MLDKRYVYPQEFPGVQYENCHTAIGSFFASIRKPYLDPFAKLRKNTMCFDSANYMTNRWHFDITVTQAEDLERNYIRNICFVTRSTHITDGFDMFSGAWVSFNLKMEIHELNTNFSLGLLKSTGV